MKPPRAARPLLPRKPLKNGTWGYFFNVPTWARNDECPIKNEALGPDSDAAVARAEKVLLPALDSWRKGGDVAAPGAFKKPIIATPGTRDWLFAEYRTDRRFTKLDSKTKRNHEVRRGLKSLGEERN